VGAFDPYIPVKSLPLFFLSLFLQLQFLISLDESQGIRLFRGIPDFLFSSVIFIVFDILTKRSVEKYRLLTHNSQFTAQIMNIIIFDVLSIDCDFALIWKIKALKQLHNGRFAASWWANKGYLLTRMDFDIHITENILLATLVLKSNVLEFNMANYSSSQHSWLLSLLNLSFILRIQNLKNMSSWYFGFVHIWDKMRVVSNGNPSKEDFVDGSENI